MLRIILPANAMLIIQKLIPTVGFDLLNSYFDWTSQSVLEFDFDQHGEIKDTVFN